MSEFTINLRNIENMKNDRERIEVSNFYVTNYLREHDCCISLEDWKTVLFYDYDPWCLIYEVVEHWTPEKERTVAKIWWNEFEKINTNDYGQITEPFMFWPEGTDQFDIMDAFKDFFDIDVVTDKDFMGFESIEKGIDMENMEKIDTLYFADGETADVFCHGKNDYSICFHDGDYSVRGSFLDMIKEVKKKENRMKSKSTNNKNLTPDMCFDEENHPMVSNGMCLNFWTTGGDYDVFIVYHELEIHQHEEVVEKVVHYIMNHRKVNDTKEQLSKKIHNALEALVDWEYNTPHVIVDNMKEGDN